jgi:uncharacterized peroxidase-related enzyme
MQPITVPSFEQVSPGAQVLFDQLKKRLGKVPNLYAIMGSSEHALKGFMDLELNLYKGVFRPKEREAVALVVSEVNGCEYCLAAHTLAAIKAGLTEDQTLEIRKGASTDSKLNAIVALAKAIAETKGNPSADLLDNFYAAGYDTAALMELVGLITVRIFTNYVFALTHIPIDFPTAPSLK